MGLTEPFTVAGVGGQPEEAGLGREAPYALYVYMCECICTRWWRDKVPQASFELDPGLPDTGASFALVAVGIFLVWPSRETQGVVCSFSRRTSRKAAQ